MTNSTRQPTRDRHQQPIVGISACLRGEQVRYDGGHKHQQLIDELLALWLKLIPFCPEVAAGLGVPRPPVSLIKTELGVQALTIDNHELNVTAPLIQTSELFVQDWGVQLTAYIVKSRSPSCGAGSTPLYSGEGTQLGSTDGLFVRALRSRFPKLLIVDEGSLNSPDSCRHFLAQCYQHRQTE